MYVFLISVKLSKIKPCKSMMLLRIYTALSYDYQAMCGIIEVWLVRSNYPDENVGYPNLLPTAIYFKEVTELGIYIYVNAI